MKDIRLPLGMLRSKTAIDNASLPNSVLSREQADRFIDMVVDTSVLMKYVRVERVNNKSGEVNKLDIADVVTEGANTTSRASTRTPSEKVMSYDCEKYRSAFDITSDFEEDNIEGAAIRDKLMTMFTKRISTDTEIAAIQGDDSLTTGDSSSALNNLLGVNDGWSKILKAEVPSAQQVDAAGAAPSAKLYYDMRRKIPARYRVAKPSYKWIMPSGPYDKWSLDWSARETSGGDAALSNWLVPPPWGIDRIEVPLMPEDLTWGTAGTDGSEIWLTPPENLVVFFRRDITFEFERQPRQDCWEVNNGKTKSLYQVA
jgi:hypothetical protein